MKTKLEITKIAILFTSIILLNISCEKEDTPCQLKTWYQDSDGDGYGSSLVPRSSCVPPAGFVSSNDDCNDNDRFINPGMDEISSDGIDNNCDGQSLISIGDFYQGGIVFYIDESGQHGLIASPIDQGNNSYWCNDTSGSCWVNNTRNEIGYGKQNTINILNTFGKGNYAAQFCVNSTVNDFDDWFLPSYDELDLMYNNLYLAGIGDFEDKAYWSSSFKGVPSWPDGVYIKEFSIQSSNYYIIPPYSKGSVFINVRGIRKF